MSPQRRETRRRILHGDYADRFGRRRKSSDAGRAGRDPRVAAGFPPDRRSAEQGLRLLVEHQQARDIRPERDGFTGKMAIHPAQVAPINEVFAPSPEALAKAEQIIALFAANPGAGVIGLHGEMLDRPHLIRAERLVARARKLAE